MNNSVVNSSEEYQKAYQTKVRSTYEQAFEQIMASSKHAPLSAEDIAALRTALSQLDDVETRLEAQRLVLSLEHYRLLSLQLAEECTYWYSLSSIYRRVFRLAAWCAPFMWPFMAIGWMRRKLLGRDSWIENLAEPADEYVTRDGTTTIHLSERTSP